MLFEEGNTGGLFSAGIMVRRLSTPRLVTISHLIQQSGSPARIPDVLEQQIYFDNLVSATNCTEAPDRFECLRQAPYPALRSAVDESPSMISYQSLNLAWSPVIDGTLIPRNPLQLLERGKYAKVSEVGPFSFRLPHESSLLRFPS